MVYSRNFKFAAAIIIVAALFFALGWINKKPHWAAFPESIIVDAPEDFQRMNTPH